MNLKLIDDNHLQQLNYAVDDYKNRNIIIFLKQILLVYNSQSTKC